MEILELVKSFIDLLNPKNLLEHRRIKKIEKKIVRYEDTFFTLKGDKELIRYCTRCWEVDRKTVQIICNSNGHFTCPHCNNRGIYDKRLVKRPKAPHVI